MTAPLTGRDLDAACARAMGWTTDGGLWFAPGDKDQRMGYRLAHYSTEFGPQTQAMLDWLVARDGVVHVHAKPAGVRAFAFAIRDIFAVTLADGSSHPEALARLVVAAAEREGGAS